MLSIYYQSIDRSLFFVVIFQNLFQNCFLLSSIGFYFNWKLIIFFIQAHQDCFLQFSFIILWRRIEWTSWNSLRIFKVLKLLHLFKKLIFIKFFWFLLRRFITALLITIILICLFFSFLSLSFWLNKLFFLHESSQTIIPRNRLIFFFRPFTNYLVNLIFFLFNWFSAFLACLSSGLTFFRVIFINFFRNFKFTILAKFSSLGAIFFMKF